MSAGQPCKASIGNYLRCRCSYYPHLGISRRLFRILYYPSLPYRISYFKLGAAHFRSRFVCRHHGAAAALPILCRPAIRWDKRSCPFKGALRYSCIEFRDLQHELQGAGLFLKGFARSRLLVNLIGFTIRYTNILTDELSRMKKARKARGYSKGRAPGIPPP